MDSGKCFIEVAGLKALKIKLGHPVVVVFHRGSERVGVLFYLLIESPLSPPAPSLDWAPGLISFCIYTLPPPPLPPLHSPAPASTALPTLVVIIHALTYATAGGLLLGVAAGTELISFGRG
jgi:hypothetical protein